MFGRFHEPIPAGTVFGRLTVEEFAGVKVRVEIVEEDKRR